MFEIVRTVEGLPDPGAYPEGLSHTPRYSGSAMVVYFEFPDEVIAQSFATCEKDHDLDNPILEKYKPFGAGLDIFYIKQLTPEEVLEVKMAKARVLYKMYADILDQETFEKLIGLTINMETLTEPTVREEGLFYKEINEIVVEEFYSTI
ncbi:MAG: hypothetical protein H6779_00625 [Candidatus Nomurabacteria bacterium]|nr:MAG: hypothetical protein H6779_00625 [Candidatus Nomurabacteria bacterium]